MLQEASDFWNAIALHRKNVSGDFNSREFAAAHQHLKPGKALSPHSIRPELEIHAGADLKSWLYALRSREND